MHGVKIFNKFSVTSAHMLFLLAVLCIFRPVQHANAQSLLHYTFNELFLQYLQYFFYGNIPLKPHLCYNDYVYLLTIFKGK